MLRDGRPQLAGDFLRLAESERRVADRDLVHVAKPDRLMDAAFIEEGPVAAAEIDQPELADVLQIDDAMTT